MTRFKQSRAVKIVAFILLFSAIIASLIAGDKTVRDYSRGFYNILPQEFTLQQMREQMYEDARYITHSCLYAEDRAAFNAKTREDRPNSFYEFYVNGQKLAGDYDGSKVRLTESFDTTWIVQDEMLREEEVEGEMRGGEMAESGFPRMVEGIISGQAVSVESVSVTLYVRETLVESEFDAYYGAQRYTAECYATRGQEIPLLVGALTLGALCLIVLLVTAGHKRGEAGIALGRFDKIPLDLLAAVTLLLLVIDFANRYNFFGLVFWGSLTGVIGIGTLMSFAARLKAGGGLWWRNTLVHRGVRLLKKAGNFFGEYFKTGLAKTPFFWKCMLGLALVLLADALILQGFAQSRSFGFFVLFLIEKFLLAVLAIIVVLWIKNLSIAAEKISGGDLTYQVDTTKMFGEFKKQGNHMNNIAGGMTQAVEEKMRSERMKTELITNVSHDIKTPLTSIINYVDLLGKEESENEKVAEYTQVLSRQADKLKRLVTDLVDASKISSGNVEVQLIPSDICVLAGQIDGEYRDRLLEKGLELIIHTPEAPVFIMGDGRHLLRIIDNLMNNVLKYAQEGSRVYLDIINQDKTASFILRNMSGYQLNVSADELMERFVRGDSARHTEGNGLGLSIARSLTEVQGGSLGIHIDGDLFKVTLSFPSL